MKLDMSDSTKLGNALHLEINKAVKDYKETLPDQLILNRKQFVSLVTSMDQMYQSKDFMFKTPDNVMEVEVR